MRENFLAFILLFTLFQASSQNEEALVLGDQFYALGNYREAIIQYEQVAGASSKIAKSYEALGNFGKASEYYQLTLSSTPEALLPKYNFGKLLLKTARFEKADSLFSILEGKDPGNPNFAYYRGLVAERRNDSTAEAHFIRVISLDGAHQHALYRLAKMLLEKRQFDRARGYIDAGLVSDSKSIRFINLKALLHFAEKDYHGALAAYKELVELGQSTIQLHENLATSYRNTNQFEKALEQYTILINEYDDQISEWHYGLGITYISLKNYEKSRRHIEIAILLKDLPIEDELMSLSYMYGAQKKYRNQMEVLNRVVNMYPSNERAQYFLAAAADNYYEDKKLAIPFYEKYLKKYGETGRFREYGKQRLKDIKTGIHFNGE